MGGNPRPTVICLLLACLSCGWPAAAANGQEPSAARQEYQRWVARHSMKTPSLEGLKLVVTAVDGEDQADEPLDNRFGTGVTLHGCKVSSNGAVSHFYLSDWGRKGGSGSSMPPADLTRLDELLANLPDDGSRLPPSGDA